MPTKKTNKHLRRTTRNKKTAGTGTPKRKTAPSRRLSTPRKLTVSKTKPHRNTEETTFVYECTSPGCGYRIWREDKGESGQLRFDLKCPKCHNESFRCLGKGDVPESFNEPLAPTTLDFDKLDKVETGTN